MAVGSNPIVPAVLRATASGSGTWIRTLEDAARTASEASEQDRLPSVRIPKDSLRSSFGVREPTVRSLPSCPLSASEASGSGTGIRTAANRTERGLASGENSERLAPLIFQHSRTLRVRSLPPCPSSGPSRGVQDDSRRWGSSGVQLYMRSGSKHSYELAVHSGGYRPRPALLCRSGRWVICWTAGAASGRRRVDRISGDSNHDGGRPGQPSTARRTVIQWPTGTAPDPRRRPGDRATGVGSLSDTPFGTYLSCGTNHDCSSLLLAPFNSYEQFVAY